MSVTAMSGKKMMTLNDTYDYAKFIFDYVMYMNKLYDKRATGLLTAVSIIEVTIILGITNMISVMSPPIQPVMMLGTAGTIVLFGSSICFGLAMFPRSPEPSSRVYYDFIRRLRQDDFHSEVGGTEMAKMIENICREAHVVSGVVEAKERWLKAGHVSMVAGVVILIIFLYVTCQI